MSHKGNRFEYDVVEFPTGFQMLGHKMEQQYAARVQARKEAEIARTESIAYAHASLDAHENPLAHYSEEKDVLLGLKPQPRTNVTAFDEFPESIKQLRKMLEAQDQVKANYLSRGKAIWAILTN